MCPGKNIAAGRDGKCYERDILKDVSYFKNEGVSMIICLLNDSEIRSIGLNRQ